jgi:hypothetical protein
MNADTAIPGLPVDTEISNPIIGVHPRRFHCFYP